MLGLIQSNFISFKNIYSIMNNISSNNITIIIAKNIYQILVW